MYQSQANLGHVAPSGSAEPAPKELAAAAYDVRAPNRAKSMMNSYNKVKQADIAARSNYRHNPVSVSHLSIKPHLNAGDALPAIKSALGVKAGQSAAQRPSGHFHGVLGR